MKTVLRNSLLLALLAGCTNQTAWEPTIDMDQETNPTLLLNDRNHCQETAFAASTRPHATADQETFGAATLGSLAGAAIGSVIGLAKHGAILGGAAGMHAIAGDRRYRHVFTQCLVDRGHVVLNP